MKRAALAGLIVISFLVPASANERLEIRTAAQKSAPKYFVGDDETTQGICPDIIRAIERIDPELSFVGYENFVPFKRLQHQLETGEIDVFFGLKKTRKRLAKYHFIDIPLYNLSYRLATLATQASIYGETATIENLSPEARIVTVNGSAAADFIKHNYPDMLIDDSPRTPANMIQMLLHGRNHLAFYHDMGFAYVIKSLELENRVIILPKKYSSYSHFTAFSPRAPEQTVTKVKKALESLRDTGELDQIFNRHIAIQKDGDSISGQ